MTRTERGRLAEFEAGFKAGVVAATECIEGDEVLEELRYEGPVEGTLALVAGIVKKLKSPKGTKAEEPVE